ncbi:hypothetical protein T03_5085 [Trichinella britovi]|uniref:Uncharacterized protein n=1 Tax=Trichinella britovi TaxID=45882 RepID=A0A0V1C4J4_TRIBR|nr:hypothetical protein T03_5085 [Trichinella britovi]
MVKPIRKRGRSWNKWDADEFRLALIRWFRNDFPGNSVYFSATVL